MMMYELLQEQLQSIRNVLKKMQPVQYQQPCSMLGANSIGQHVRHVAEMLQCLLNGYQQGIIDYDARERNKKIETDLFFSMALLQQLSEEAEKPDKGLTLNTGTCKNAIHTTYYRELHYNTEHTIHHMALIKVAFREMGLNLADENFGVAGATIQYRKQNACVQ